MAKYPGTKVVDDDHHVDFNASCSGMYDTEKESNDYRLELKIDVDRPNAFQRSLNFVSGTVKVMSKKMWSGRASAGYFRARRNGVQVLHDDDTTIVNAPIYVTLSDGGRREGHLSASCKKSRGKFYCNVKLQIEDTTAVFKNVVRQSTHYRDVTIDIDYVVERYWPVIDLNKYKELPANYRTRKLDLFSVFEDAGLKLHYNAENSEEVKDPTKNTPWSKADMFELMKVYFDEEVDKDVDCSIWCLMANEPPDSRYMGFSFDYEGNAGFGLFAGHSSFEGMNDSCPNVQAQAKRRFLHYLAHECGHTLGLAHPFEEGDPNALSWMNYAYRYNTKNGEGSFYKSFLFSFSDKELIILRHQPDNLFKRTFKKESGVDYQYSPGPKSVAPASDDSDDEDDDQKVTPERKLKFEIKVRPQPYSKGDIVEFEATLRNVGKLPCKIEPGLVPGGGTLTVFVTNPLGEVKIVKPFAIGIDAPTRKYIILGQPGSAVKSSSYSEVVPLIQSSSGGLFEKLGTYQIDASYEAAGLRATSETVDIVVEEDNDDDDDITKADVRISAELDGNVGESRAKRVVDYWKKQIQKPVDIKAKRIQTLLRLLKGLSKSSIKLVSASKGSRKKRRRKQAKKVSNIPGYISAEQLCADTDDLVKFCHSSYGNGPTETQSYVDLVLERTKLLKDFNLGQAETEYNQLVADLVGRGVKYEFVKDVASQWKTIALPKVYSREDQLKSFQERVKNIMYWEPKEKVEVGTNEQSGLGLGMPFNTFDDDHRGKVEKFVLELQSVENDTNDFEAILDFIEAKQQSLEINHMLFQFTFERFIVRSKLAKKLHITYPDPLKMNPEYLSQAAIVTTERFGRPEEVWMNYWRCNGEFNHHHRHWHAVYGGGSFSQTLASRQGELFFYMHSQLLARYDAERESWGLAPVQPWEYDDVDRDGFNAGFEFHNAFPNCLPRPKNHTWERQVATDLQGNETDILGAFKNSELPDGASLDSNLAGHIVEASSGGYQHYYGSMHNMGHMAFVRFAGRQFTSFMGSTVTAVRDPIFFRWHKRIDNLLQFWNEKERTELALDAPGVIVEPSDVIISTGRKEIDGFKNWNGSNWSKTNFKSDIIKTFMEPLNENAAQFEWDNQLKHDQFTYHIRVRRRAGVQGDIVMTFRLFICQERYRNKRRKWIEMDKFVHRMDEGKDHLVVSRKDVESSVIKRTHADSAGITEPVKIVAGNCECGWPNNMMLPRGERDGENWVLSCMISDNTIDNIESTTACGSMSYCGTLDQVYPDQRVMGYPFSTPITLNGKEESIIKAEEKLSNFTFSNFTIVSNYDFQKPAPPPVRPPIRPPPTPVTPPRPSLPVLIWKPFAGSDQQTSEDNYSKSRSRLYRNARMRVLLDDIDFLEQNTDRIRLSFKARPDNQEYAIKNVKIARRWKNSSDVVSNFNVDVLFNGRQNAVIRPQDDKVLSDEIVLKHKPGEGVDYFVTFTLEGSGCYLYSSDVKRINTYVVPQKYVRQAENDDNWSRKRFVHRRTRSVYCVEAAVSLS